MEGDQGTFEEPPVQPEVRRLPSPDRTYSVTPHDLRQARLRTSMRGFDRNDVTALLNETADAFEQSLRENERLRLEIGRLEGSIGHYREIEGTLKSAILSAQKVGDEMRENATQEAARLIREAESRAALITEKAEHRLEEIQREIDALRLRRRDVERNVSGIITSLSNTLEFIREHDDRDVRVVGLRRIEAAS